MINLYFGMPGTGKTSMIAYLAHNKSFRRKYKNLYTNIDLADTDYIRIENDWIGKYNITDGAILIDEGSIFADNRDYKNFSKALTNFIMLHRHYRVDIYIWSQQYNAVDKKIRSLTNNLYYMYKPLLTGWYKTKWYKIPYGIVIPDRKKNKERTGNSLGEIEEGYCKPSLIQRIFARSFNRRKTYRYFDSWEAPELPPIPDKYQSLKAYPSERKTKE